MLTITKTAANRVDIELEGSLDSESMAAGLDDLIAKSEGVTGGHMLYRIRDFSMPTPGAIAVEIKRLPKLFALLGKFNRCAVLCDASWLRTVAEIEGALFPGVAIKSFEPDQEAAAEAWLNEG